jgi:hypothetical protein
MAGCDGPRDGAMGHSECSSEGTRPEGRGSREATGESGGHLADSASQRREDCQGQQAGPGSKPISADCGELADAGNGQFQEQGRGPEGRTGIGPTGPFAPGPSDPRWSAILRERPALAPALESPLRGMADGLPDQLDADIAAAMQDRTKRLGRLGNAVVPQVAEWIGRRIRAQVVPAMRLRSCGAGGS